MVIAFETVFHGYSNHHTSFSFVLVYFCRWHSAEICRKIFILRHDSFHSVNDAIIFESYLKGFLPTLKSIYWPLNSIWLFSFFISGIPISTAGGTPITTRKSIFTLSLPNMTVIFFAALWQVSMVPPAALIFFFVDRMIKSNFLDMFVDTYLTPPLYVLSSEHLVCATSVGKPWKFFQSHYFLLLQSLLSDEQLCSKEAFAAHFAPLPHLLEYVLKRKPRCRAGKCTHHIMSSHPFCDWSNSTRLLCRLHFTHSAMFFVGFECNGPVFVQK